MNEELVNFISKYFEYFVALEPDAPQLRSRVREDLMKIPSVESVIFGEGEPMPFIKVFDNNGNVGTWSFSGNEQ